MAFMPLRFNKGGCGNFNGGMEMKLTESELSCVQDLIPIFGVCDGGM